jgi:hypothetical protein
MHFEQNKQMREGRIRPRPNPQTDLDYLLAFFLTPSLFPLLHPPLTVTLAKQVIFLTTEDLESLPTEFPLVGVNGASLRSHYNLHLLMRIIIQILYLAILVLFYSGMVLNSP